MSEDKRKSIAFYTQYRHLCGNGLFTSKRLAGSYPVQPFVLLRDRLLALGYGVNTHDVLPDPSAIDLIVVVDLPSSPAIVDRLRKSSPNAKIILYILESPPHHPGQFDSRNYRCFDAVITYGRRPKGSRNVFRCPIPCDQFQLPFTSLPDWSSRHLLVAINTRKRAGFMCPSGYGPLSRLGVRGLGEGWKMTIKQFFLQWKGYRYSFRNRLVYWLDKNIGAGHAFHVYGNGWNGAPPIGYLERVLRPPSLQRSWKGSHEGCKSNVLVNYRYAIIVENWVGNEGYVSEKIFEALQCGCIPVYWGDSSVESIVPRLAWIDGSRFRHPSQLLEYLASEGQAIWTERLRQSQGFLDSKRYNEYTPDGYACRMASLLHGILREHVDAEAAT